MKLYELQKKCSPKGECPLRDYCMKKGYSENIPACAIDMDNLEETVEERRMLWKPSREYINTTNMNSSIEH